MTSPTCGYTCVTDTTNEYWATCNLNVPCVCRNQNFVQAFYSCISSVCSAADIEAWNQVAKKNCALYGATFPAFSVSVPGSTAPVTSVVTAVLATPSTITLIETTSQPAFFGASVPSPSTTFVVSSSGPVSIPTSQSTTSAQSTNSSALSTGAIAGIAVGAAIVVLLALIGGFLIWRHNRSSSGASHNGGAPNDGGETTGIKHSDLDREGKPSAITKTIVTSVKTPPELSDEPVIPDHRYVRPNPTHELPFEQRTVQTSLSQPHGPAPAYSEVEGHVASEMDTAVYRLTSNAAPADTAEVDSRAVSPMHQHISELSPSSFTIRHELPTSIESTFPNSARAPEIPTQQSIMPSATYSDPAAKATPSAAGEEDTELERMKAEIEAIRTQKERIQQIHAIEERERELSRMIVERQLGTSRR